MTTFPIYSGIKELRVSFLGSLYTLTPPSLTNHVHQESFEVLHGLRLPELVSLPPPLLLLGRPAQFHFPLSFLQAGLDTFLPCLLGIRSLGEKDKGMDMTVWLLAESAIYVHVYAYSTWFLHVQV